ARASRAASGGKRSASPAGSNPRWSLSLAVMVPLDSSLLPFIHLSPARGRGRVRGRRTFCPPHLTSPPSGGEEQQLFVRAMTDFPRPALSVVAPCYNEEGVLPEFLQRMGAVLDGLGQSSEIVLVDDGSRDDTWNVMRQAASG